MRQSRAYIWTWARAELMPELCSLGGLFMCPCKRDRKQVSEGTAYVLRVSVQGWELVVQTSSHQIKAITAQKVNLHESDHRS